MGRKCCRAPPLPHMSCTGGSTNTTYPTIALSPAKWMRVGGEFGHAILLCAPTQCQAATARECGRWSQRADIVPGSRGRTTTLPRGNRCHGNRCQTIGVDVAHDDPIAVDYYNATTGNPIKAGMHFKSNSHAASTWTRPRCAAFGVCPGSGILALHLGGRLLSKLSLRAAATQ